MKDYKQQAIELLIDIDDMGVKTKTAHLRHLRGYDKPLTRKQFNNVVKNLQCKFERYCYDL